MKLQSSGILAFIGRISLVPFLISVLFLSTPDRADAQANANTIIQVNALANSLNIEEIEFYIADPAGAFIYTQTSSAQNLQPTFPTRFTAAGNPLPVTACATIRRINYTDPGGNTVSVFPESKIPEVSGFHPRVASTSTASGTWAPANEITALLPWEQIPHRIGDDPNPAYFDAINEVISIPCMRRYWDLGGSALGTASEADPQTFADIMYDRPIRAGDIVVISERWGNTPMSFTPLDINGNVIVDGATVSIGGVAKPDLYSWNTLIQHGVDANGSQEQWLVVFNASLFYNNDDTLPLVYGWRVNMTTTDGGDGKILLFRETALAVIGGRVWLDENSDGIQDAGEPGIANVTVDLIDVDDVVLATTVTDTEGRYVFTDWPGGTYTVRVDTDSMAARLVENPTFDEDGITTPHEIEVTVLSGGFHLTADFGYNWSETDDVLNDTGTGAIGDRVWIDANGDGVQDPSESGLGGILVEIFIDSNGDGIYDELFTDAVDQNGNTGTGSTVTQPDGSYAFYDLPPGAYVIVVNGGVTPVGYTQTGDPDFFGQTLPLGQDDNRTTMPVILAPGDVFVNADFGYQPASSSDISGRVYFDANANGVEDGDDFPIPNVTVVLLDENDRVISTTVTDEDGDYEFTGLPAGEFTVWVNDTAGLLSRLRQTEDPDAILDNRTTVVLDGSTDSTGNDFGYTPIGNNPIDGLIGDTIWLDVNGDGIRNPGEPGIQGVTVELYAADGITLLTRTITDANGNYWFGGLGADDPTTFIVRVDTSTLPNGGVGLVNTADPDGPSPVGDSESEVTIGPGDLVNLDQDFGYQVVPASANLISGTIWEDRNADGELDGDEPGRFAGVTVILSDEEGNRIGSTVTDGSGNYFFPGLPDGTYIVDVTDRENILNGYWHSKGDEGDGTAVGTPPGQSQPDPYTITVTGGETGVVDFGYYVAGATLGNRVWLDTNGNGQQDPGEVGLPNVLVRLEIRYPSGDTNIITTVTDADGFFSFGNLLLDENQDGDNPATPEFILSVVNPDDPAFPYHTLHNAPGVPEALNSVFPLGAVAIVLQGQDSVVATVDPEDEPPNAWFDFGFTPVPTLAVISGVRSRVENGIAIISWDVALEVDAMGYYLERWMGDEWIRVSGSMALADPFMPAPNTYEQADSGAALGSTQRYRIVELDGQGRLLTYGPYDLRIDGGEISYATWAAGIDWGDADSSPDADPDGDGLTNWQEYLAGTDPLDANSVLRVTNVRSEAGDVELTWPSSAGRRYTIEMALSLDSGFVPVAAGIEASPDLNIHVLPVSPEAVSGAFFRVVVE